MSAGADLLRIENLQVSFSIMGGQIEAVRGASLRILPGKVTALVGESGSGKSVIGQTIMGIQPRTARVNGRVLFSDPLNPTNAPSTSCNWSPTASPCAPFAATASA